MSFSPSADLPDSLTHPSSHSVSNHQRAPVHHLVSFGVAGFHSTSAPVSFPWTEHLLSRAVGFGVRGWPFARICCRRRHPGFTSRPQALQLHRLNRVHFRYGLSLRYLHCSPHRLATMQLCSTSRLDLPRMDSHHLDMCAFRRTGAVLCAAATASGVALRG